MIDRALTALQELRSAESDYLAGMPFRATPEHDMRGGRYMVRATVATPPPAALGGLALAVVSELREAIDALASSLAGKPVRFPIYESLSAFAQRTRKVLASMPDEGQAAIEALQPYHAIGGFVKGPLWSLRELHEAGSPRLAGFLRAATMGVNTQRKVLLDGDPVLSLGAFEDGATLATTSVKIVGPDPKLDMFFRPEYALAFPVDGPARGREVIPLLESLCRHVEHEVCPALERGQPR